MKAWYNKISKSECDLRDQSVCTLLSWIRRRQRHTAFIVGRDQRLSKNCTWVTNSSRFTVVKSTPCDSKPNSKNRFSRFHFTSALHISTLVWINSITSNFHQFAGPFISRVKSLCKGQFMQERFSINISFTIFLFVTLLLLLRLSLFLILVLLLLSLLLLHWLLLF